MKLGQTYELDGQVFQLGEIKKPIEGLFLKNLNRSAMWNNGKGKPSGYCEGYLVHKNRARYYGYDFEDGYQGVEYQPWDVDEPDVLLSQFMPCGVETEVIDMGQWRPDKNGKITLE